MYLIYLQQILNVCNQPANAQWISLTGCWIGLYWYIALKTLLFSIVLMLSLFNNVILLLLFFFHISLFCFSWLLCLGTGSANYYCYYDATGVHVF